MEQLDDSALLRRYVESESDEAFTALVTRHINLVYSVALRQTGSADHAEEIAQVVFIILARKAKELRHEKALSSWLFRTTRLTTANLLRSEGRRLNREQEAYMQSTLNEAIDDTWVKMAPLVDSAVASLREKDRQAILLRFYEGRNLQEVGAALGASENAAGKRVNRALDCLRLYFSKRGVSSTTAIISDKISAHSVQAAPAALAKTVAAAAIAKGVTGSGSTLTLVKGALKLMAWTKAKTAIVAGAAILFTAGTATIIAQKAILPGRAVLKQWLPDGTLLTLRGVSFGDKHEFVEGSKKKSWNTLGEEQLVFQLALTGKNAKTNPLVQPAFYRQIRGVLHGEQGIEYSEELFQLKAGGDSYYGYITADTFPRDSHWLWLRLEKAATNQPFSGWETIAQFKIANPAGFTNSNWTAEPTPITHSAGDMSFTLGDITLQTNAQQPDWIHSINIWIHSISVPITVLQKGLPVTNWAPAYMHVADASGNSDYWNGLPAWDSLDPRFVWKMDMDFEPTSDFPADEVATITLPGRNSKVVTKVRNVLVTISWDGTWVDANVPTNEPDMALRFVEARTGQNEVARDAAGNWNQFHFRKGYFMALKGGVLNMDGAQPTAITVAIVPNIHTTFYAQPSGVTDSVAQK